MQRKQEERRKEFKKTIDQEDLRRRRDSDTNQLRKSKREESLMKRRTGVVAEQPAPQVVDGTSTTSSSIEATPQNDRERDITVALQLVRMGDANQRAELLAMFESSDVNDVLKATTQIRRMLSVENEPPINEILHMGVVPKLVHYLKFHEQYPTLTLEAAWALTNIASGTSAQTRAVVEAGALPIFVSLLAIQSEQVREQSVWALGNIAGDGAQLRDLCLQNSVMEGLLYQYTLNPGASLLRNTTWAISNLCRGKPAPAFDAVVGCVPKLAELLNTGDNETVADAAWALSYLTDGDDSKIQVVVDAGVCPRLVQLLSHTEKSIQTPALRCVGNIVTGTEQQTQTIVDLRPFVALGNLLMSKKKALVKEACWTISNITAGTPSQVQAVVQSGLLSAMSEMLLRGDHEIKKESCWAISNATTGGTFEQTRQFVEEKTVHGLIDLMRVPEPKICLVAMEAIENILRAGEVDEAMMSKIPSSYTNLYTDWFDEFGGIELLEKLQESKSEAVYKRASSILEEFFEGEAQEDGADENVAPNQVIGSNGAQQFAFGAAANNNSAFGHHSSSSFAF